MFLNANEVKMNSKRRFSKTTPLVLSLHWIVHWKILKNLDGYRASFQGNCVFSDSKIFSDVRHLSKQKGCQKYCLSLQTNSWKIRFLLSQTFQARNRAKVTDLCLCPLSKNLMAQVIPPPLIQSWPHQLTTTLLRPSVPFAQWQTYVRDRNYNTNAHSSLLFVFCRCRCQSVACILLWRA